MTESPILEIFSDYVWPWCYFITGRIERLKRKFEIEVRWVAFPLRPDTPETGISMEDLFSARGIDPDRVQARLEKAAGEVGLPFGKRVKTYNSRLAQELGKWAEAMGKGDAFHDAVFRACLVDGENIARGSVLAGLAGSLGLPENEAEEVLESRAFKGAVDEDWVRSRTMKIKVAPTMVINEKMLVGAQKYKKMERFLRANDVKERNTES